jgi:UTP-glucose-1-phosphate uridylyltransferase
MKVTTAVIFAAGFGSRMLPVTSAVQKELLPILDRPIVDYVVADCVAAGVTHIIFVIRPNSHGLQDFYTGNSVLEGHLQRFGKTKTWQTSTDPFPSHLYLCRTTRGRRLRHRCAAASSCGPPAQE